MIRMYQRSWNVLILLFGLAAIAAGQPGQQPAFTCTANAGAPVIVRVEGITELVGDLLLQCRGGNNTGIADTHVNVREGFAQSFKRQAFSPDTVISGVSTFSSTGSFQSLSFHNVAPQNVPGYAYNTESGFQPTLSDGQTALDSRLGTAAFGTRILLRFSNVGIGARLLVPGVVPLTIDNGTTPAVPLPPSAVSGWTGGYLVLLGTSDRITGDVQSPNGVYNFTGQAVKIIDPNPVVPAGIASLIFGPDGSCTLNVFNGTNTLLPGTGAVGPDGKCTVLGTGNIFGTVSIQQNLVFNPPVLGPSGFTVSGIDTLTGQPAAGDFANTYNITGVLAASLATLSGTIPVTTIDPVSTATGELFSGYAPDNSLGGPLPLVFQRYYASYLAPNGVTSSLGKNWMHNFDVKLVVNGNTATVALFGGGMVQFQQSGGVWKVSSLGRLAYQLVASGTGFRFLHPASNLIYTFDSTGELTKIEDRNGNALTVTPSQSGPTQVSDGAGRTLSFSYSAGKLAEIQDQSGRTVTFTNDGTNLTGVTNANGQTTTFTYTTAGGMTGLMTGSVRPGGNKPYTQAFDGFGRVSQQTDSLGNKTTLAYNSGGTPGVTVLTDALSRTSKYVYANLVDLSSYTDAAGQSGSVAYDPQVRPISSTDRLGNKTTATYDKASGYPASITDAAGNTTTFTYAAQSQTGFTFYNLTKAAYADGTSASFTYDASGNVLTATNRAGKTHAYTYNSRGQALTAKNAAGGVTTYTYNNDATLASVKSPAGDTTTSAYDNLKRPTKIQYADNTSASFTWDALDQLLMVTDERGKVTKLAYDPNTNLKSVTDALNQTAGLAYDTDDLLSTSTDRLGKVAKFQYDAIGNQTAATNAAGEKTSFSYDALDRLKSAADPSGKGLSFTYDAEGRLVTATDAVSNTAKFTVDKLGRTMRSTTPLSENFDSTYDAVSRITATTNALSQKTSYSYENRDLVTGLTLPGGISASYTWGDLPVLTGITDPNGNSWARAYDSMGRLTSVTDPLGQATTLTYDPRNRVSSLTNPVGSVQVSYDAAGNLMQSLYSDATTLSFTYDDDNRVTGGNGVSLIYDSAGRIVASNGLPITRDDVGRISSIGYAPGAVTYAYDARGLLTTVSDWVGGTTSFAYDDAQRMISITRPNGVVTQYSYDKDGRPSSITETGGGNTLASIALQRDGLGRVVSADRNLPQTPSLVSGVLPLGYDAAHQISGFTYDALGRLTNGDLSSTYTWDMGSRLSSYSRADGSASFTYDDFGLRISRTGSDGTTLGYTLNYALPLPSVAVLQASGADVRYYVHLPDGTLFYSIEAADNSRHFFQFDETGSTTFLTDDSGAITDSYGITPYGEIVSQTGTTNNPFTFQGRWGVMQEPGTSLYYMRYRYYDSTPARFLTRDPVLSLEPREINPYQYVAGDPLASVDPMGLKGIGSTLGLTSRAGVVPISHNQDVVGPHARTVADAAAVLSALVGVDPRDPATVTLVGTVVVMNGTH